MTDSKLLAAALRCEVVPHVALSEAQIAALCAHYELLTRWNARLNLTTVVEPRLSATRHYGESLILGALLAGGERVADVGSGAGFPGIPVAILRPELRVDLIESHRRKAVFLREAARELPNLRVLAERAEAVPGGYDWVVSRAVDPAAVVKLQLGAAHALLVGIDDANTLSGFEIQALPWGDRRVVAVQRFT